MDESRCEKCGKIRIDKVFGYIDDPCRCEHKESKANYDHSEVDNEGTF